ncbi:MAG: glycosyltransferase 87 family protein [Candidatus Kariarchaeaceae archaeon]|jgi:hypothetical protein
MDEERVSSSFLKKNFLLDSSNRRFYYLIGLLVRIIFAGIFNDRRDGAVFFETGEDIILHHTNIYNETSAHVRFNYFPLAYLAILPGLVLYFALPFRNDILQRILQKLPLILLDMFVAYYMREKTDIIDKISSYELFILFNPIVIFASSVKGQFDIIPAFLLLLAWNSYKKGQNVRSGVFSAASVLVKQYGFIFIIFLTAILVRTDIRKLKEYILGSILITFPTIIVASILNFQGLLDHSIVYHLERDPNGYSLTSGVYWSTYNIIKFIDDRNSAIIASTVVLTSFSIILAASLIYLTYRLSSKEYSEKAILETLMVGYFVFFLLNKSFFWNYLVFFLLLWVEYKRVQEQSISENLLAWNYSFIPLMGILKNKIPLDIRDLIGTHWLFLIYSTCILAHLIIMILIQRKGIPIFKNRIIRYSYAIFLTVILFQLVYNTFL